MQLQSLRKGEPSKSTARTANEGAWRFGDQPQAEGLLKRRKLDLTTQRQEIGRDFLK